MYFVSRQIYWGVDPEDSNTVEIASGGRDYANPDMLVPKYSGEGEEFISPVEAVEAAIGIAEQWKKDESGKTINIARGYTGGNTLPFEADTVEELRSWATEAQKKLSKCDQCGDILGKKIYHLLDPADGKFCSEYCAEQYLSAMEELNSQSV